MKFCLILSLFFVINSYASPYGKRPARWSYELRSHFLNSTENLDKNGDIVDLENNGSYEEIKTGLNLEYDYSKRTTFIGDLIFNSATSNDGSFERSATNFSDLRLGFEYTMYRARFWFMPSFDIRFPLQTYSTNTDEVLANDTSIDVSAKANFSSKWGNIFGHAYFGLTYRTEGLSTLLPLGFELLAHFSKLSFAGGIKSVYSITDDEDTNNRAKRENFLSQVNAGSYKYYSINPNTNSVYADFKYYIEPQFYFGLAFEQTLFGENSYYGTTYTAKLGYSFGGERPKNLPKLRPSRFRKKQTNDRFELQFKKEEDQDANVFENRKIRYKESAPKENLDDIEKGLEIELKKSR